MMILRTLHTRKLAVVPVLIFRAFWQIEYVAANRYAYVCDISDFATKPLSSIPGAVNLSLKLTRNLKEESTHDSRNLVVTWPPYVEQTNAVLGHEIFHESEARVLQTTNSTDKNISVRMCCPALNTNSVVYYCPQPATHCGMPTSSSAPVPQCIRVSNGDAIVWSIWPIVLIWYGVLLLFSACTPTGRRACGFFLGFCAPCWYERWADEILQTDPDRAQILMRQYFRRRPSALRNYVYSVQPQVMEHQQQGIELMPVNGNHSRKLLLKTEKFHRDGVEETSVTCSICFSGVEEGDRIGTIECGHIYHKACLKEWLQRKNQCPLCLRPNVATLVEQEDNTE